MMKKSRSPPYGFVTGNKNLNCSFSVLLLADQQKEQSTRGVGSVAHISITERNEV